MSGMIEMRIKVETEKFTIYFKTLEDLKAFTKFLDILIEKVKRRTEEAVMRGYGLFVDGEKEL